METSGMSAENAKKEKSKKLNDAKRCDHICEDGSQCTLAKNRFHPEGGYHFSEKQRDASYIKSRDHSRPYHLEAEKPLRLELVTKFWGDMVPIHLKFDDGDVCGERVVAWVRPEDVWRFVPEVKDRGIAPVYHLQKMQHRADERVEITIERVQEAE